MSGTPLPAPAGTHYARAHGNHVGVRNRSASDPRHQGDPRPVGLGRVGARPGRPWSRGLDEPRGVPQASDGREVSGRVAARLAELGITLPDVAAPVAAYVPA